MSNPGDVLCELMIHAKTITLQRSHALIDRLPALRTTGSGVVFLTELKVQKSEKPSPQWCTSVSRDLEVQGL